MAPGPPPVATTSPASASAWPRRAAAAYELVPRASSWPPMTPATGRSPSELVEGVGDGVVVDGAQQRDEGIAVDARRRASTGRRGSPGSPRSPCSARPAYSSLGGVEGRAVGVDGGCGSVGKIRAPWARRWASRAAGEPAAEHDEPLDVSARKQLDSYAVRSRSCRRSPVSGCPEASAASRSVRFSICRGWAGLGVPGVAAWCWGAPAGAFHGPTLDAPRLRAWTSRSACAWRVRPGAARRSDWIADQVTRAGGLVTGEIEQRRVRPWSTQLVAPTDRGPAWFKANCRALAFEPAVQRELSRLVPDEVDAPLALDAVRGWMLTTDRGTTLGDGHEPTLDDWRAVVRLAADPAAPGGEQWAVARRGRVCRTARRTRSRQRYAWLVDQLAALPADHPSHVGADEAATLRATVGRVEQAVEELAGDRRCPSTFQHGDLHPKNVFAVDGALRIFDFGDAQWAHALEVLAVPYGWVTQLTQLPWGLVLDAYAEVWSDVVSRDALEGSCRPRWSPTRSTARSRGWGRSRAPRLRSWRSGGTPRSTTCGWRTSRFRRWPRARAPRGS